MSYRLIVNCNNVIVVLWVASSGLVLENLTEPIRCNLRLKSEFFESPGTFIYA